MAEDLLIRRIFWHGQKGPSGGMKMSCFRCSDWEEQAVESVSWPAPAMQEMSQGKCRLKDFWSETQWAGEGFNDGPTYLGMPVSVKLSRAPAQHVSVPRRP
jgi:hypothetical protein